MEKTICVRVATLKDRALRGLARVPYEHASGRYITEESAVEVPLTAYYLRLLGSGELIPAALEVHRPVLAAEEE